jgi:hypothetical protein
MVTVISNTVEEIKRRIKQGRKEDKKEIKG